MLHNLFIKLSHCPAVWLCMYVYTCGAGFELLNEPAADLEYRHHDDLLQYYQQAYKIIRAYSPNCLVVVSMLWDDYYEKWNQDLLEPEYVNVVFDW